jgi:hypothetical protein
MNRESPLAQAYLYHRQHNPRARADGCIHLARKDVAAGKSRYPNPVGAAYGGQWQPLDSMPRYASRYDRAYYCDEWPLGWRVAGRADEVYDGRAIDHKGWYTDDEGDGGTIAGYVIRLPHGHLIPGTRHSEWDGVTIYPLASFDDANECARAADGYAERTAEHERDYNRAWQAGRKAEELTESAIGNRREILTICHDLRIVRLTGDAAGYVAQPSGASGIKWIDTRESVARLCALARDRVKSLLADMQDAREERDKLRDDYGTQSGFIE